MKSQARSPRSELQQRQAGEPLNRAAGLGLGLRPSNFGLLWLWLLLLPAGLPAADIKAVVEGWLAAQTNLTTWTADFVQTRTFKTLSQPLVATGRVWFAKPNSFRWELGQPAQTIAVRDQAQLLILYPRLKRAERYPLSGARAAPLSEALALLDAGFPRDRAEFEARFRVTGLEATPEEWRLELQPVSAAARRVMPRLGLTLDRATFDLRANELVLPDGSRLRNDFGHSTWNQDFPPDLFRPAVDADFQVVEPPIR